MHTQQFLVGIAWVQSCIYIAMFIEHLQAFDASRIDGPRVKSSADTA